MLAAVAATLSGILLSNSGGGSSPDPRLAPHPDRLAGGAIASGTAISPGEIGEGAAVIARLREIFAVQDRAIRDRDETLLGSVFAADCPCLAAGRERVRQLRADRLRWVGYRSRLSSPRVRRASPTSWSVSAVVSGTTTRVETESNELLRIIPAAELRWTFVLVEPAGGGPLLLHSAEAVA